MRISIGVEDRHISIDGTTFMFTAEEFPTPGNINGKPSTGVQAIVWNGDTMFGNVQGGGSESFRDPAVIAAYVTAWETKLSDQITSLSLVAEGMKKKKSDEAAAFVKLTADLKADDDARRAAAKAD